MWQRITSSVVVILIAASAAVATRMPIPDEKDPRLIIVSEGSIKAVDPANSTFILTNFAEKETDIGGEVRISVDLKTQYWLDGKPTTMDDALKVGRSAKVTHMSGLALKVQVKSKPASP